jgi:phosphatidylglycerol:prolipoprotein diacylglycerol transferase
MVFGFIGGRLVHVVFESPEVYKEDWRRVFEFWYGGFVWYGGALLGFVGALGFILIKKIDFKQWSDFYAPILALGYGLGRVSCFIAGCCYGRTCELPWAISGRHPTQLYAVVWELMAFIVLILLEKRKSLQAGMLFVVWIFMHSIGRLIMEYYREDFRGPMLVGFSISTWISLVLLSASLLWFLRGQLDHADSPRS